MRPILFLDVDGVLNTTRTPGAWTTRLSLEPECEQVLQDLIYELNPHVVISSTHRNGYERDGFVAAFKDGWIGKFMPKTAWRTGTSRTGIRGIEIQDWLVANFGDSNWPRYVIVDDVRNFLSNQPVVIVDESRGLTSEDAGRIKRVLFDGGA